MLRALPLLAMLGSCSGGDPPARIAAPPAPGEGAVAITGVRIFDGGAVIPRGTVVIDGERIVAAGAEVTVPPGAAVIDGAGKTIMPGLIDAHTHTWDVGQLEQAAVLGITTELDMMGTASASAALARAHLSRPVADLRWAGNPVTVPGGHGTQFGLPIETLERAEDAARFVARRVEEGSHYIKLVVDDFQEWGASRPTLTGEVLEAAIAAAHRHEKLAVVHVGTAADARAAVEAGADGLVHGYWGAAPEVASLIAARGAFVVPTLSVLHSVCSRGARATRLLADDALVPYLGPDARGTLERRWPSSGGDCAELPPMVASLRRAGVTLLAGSDAPNPGTAHGASLHDELQQLVEAGLTPVEALGAATAAPARAFRLADRGRIAPGLRADLLLVDGDPTTDITATRDIVAVWSRGRRVDRDGFRDRNARATAAAARSPAVGLVSDFDDGTGATSFGSGWSASTDAIVGGASEVTIAYRDGAMSLRGEARKNPKGFVWAGALFSPGPGLMQPADLGAAREIVFRARAGVAGAYAVMLFSESRGPVPAVQGIQVGAEWAEHRLTLRSFGLDGSDLTGLFIGAVQPGRFELLIDEVAFR